MELTDLLLKTVGFEIFGTDSREPKGTGMHILGRAGLANGINPSDTVSSFAYKKYPDHDGDLLLSLPCVKESTKIIVKPGKKGFLGFGKRKAVVEQYTAVQEVASWEVLTKGGNEEKPYTLAHITRSKDTGGRRAPCIFAVVCPESLHRRVVEDIKRDFGLMKRLYEKVFPNLAENKDIYIQIGNPIVAV